MIHHSLYKPSPRTLQAEIAGVIYAIYVVNTSPYSASFHFLPERDAAGMAGTGGDGGFSNHYPR